MSEPVGDEGRQTGSPVLRRAQQRLQRWRERHGGRGVRIPDRLWALAVEVARSEGVVTTAECLRLDRQRLARRVGVEPAESRCDGPSGEVATFVELQMSELSGGCRAVVELAGGEGELVRLAVSDIRQLDVVGLVQAFWSRRR